MIAVLWLLFAIFSAVIANSKHRNAIGWFFLGLLFGPFALFAVGVMPALVVVPLVPPPPRPRRERPPRLHARDCPAIKGGRGGECTCGVAVYKELADSVKSGEVKKAAE